MADLMTYLENKKCLGFKPEPYYIPEGDALIFYFKDEESFAERVDSLLTVYRSIKTKELIGCQIKGIQYIIKKIGSFGVNVKDGTIELGLIFLGYKATISEDAPERELIMEQLSRAATENSARLCAEDLLCA